ncbi:MAG: Type fimbriae expression regulatory protein PilR [Deltaproteobacteria bacterium]|nr:Type fimbriae expression regulatory protein PilR [Deltaproteobacteria bacterium]
MGVVAAEESLVGSNGVTRPAHDYSLGHEHPGGHEQALRRRLSWFLLVRTALVTVFLAGAAWVYGPQQAAGPDPRLGLIALGYGVTAISSLLLPRVRHILLYAGVQVAVDLALVTLVILVTGGLASPLAVLYNVVILNTALLRLGRGITATAGAAAVVYGTLMTALVAAAPGELPLGQHAVSHSTIILSFFAIAGLARYLTMQLAAAESLLAARQEDLGRIEVLQQLVANAVDNGLVVTDANGRIISANPTAAEILGLPAGTSGLALDTLLPGASALAADTEATELTTSDTDDAHRQLRIKVGTVTDTFRHSIGRIYVIQDVTTVRDLEARLREQEQLEAYADTVRTSSDTAVTVFEGLVGESEPMRRVFALIAKVAPSDSTVLITGESGTGKELVARALHQRSPRAGREFVPVNCGAIPETLIESELFGHVRGAFTGAVADRPGLFRQAHRGTIFLDEIGELPLAMQVRLLRVLQDRQIVPVGGTSAVNVDVRVVAATNRDLERLVAEGQFREDLYYRLNVIRIETPSLRARPEDIPLLLLHLLRTCSVRHGKTVERVSPRTLRTLCAYSYPGNIRELENIVDHAITLCESDALTEQDLPAHLLAHPDAPAAAPAPETPTAPIFTADCNLDEQLATYEKDMLLAALERSGGVRKRAAELLGIKYRSLRHRLSKYGLASGDDDELDLGSTTYN